MPHRVPRHTIHGKLRDKLIAAMAAKLTKKEQGVVLLEVSVSTPPPFAESPSVVLANSPSHSCMPCVPCTHDSPSLLVQGGKPFNFYSTDGEGVFRQVTLLSFYKPQQVGIFGKAQTLLPLCRTCVTMFGIACLL